jgi:GT2 family glycosyltransferase
MATGDGEQAVEGPGSAPGARGSDGGAPGGVLPTGAPLAGAFPEVSPGTGASSGGAPGTGAVAGAPAPGPGPAGAADRTPRISVVIPHYNDAAALDRCLAALAEERTAGIPFEVLVVDNGSARLPEAVCAAHPGVRLLLETTPGPGPARNRGAAEARGAILAFIDSDCWAEPGWIAAIDGAFADPQTAVIGGDVRIAPRDPSRLTVVEAYESVFAYRFQLYIEHHRYTGTGNMAVRRAVFEAVGPFAGIGVAEDMDWGRRATARGHPPRYVPAMRVRTPARGSFGELARKWDRHVAHFHAENQGRRAASLRWLARTALVAASPLAEVPRLLRTDRLARPGDRARALAGVTRLRLHRARQMLRLALGADPDRLAGAWRGPAPDGGEGEPRR